MPPDDDPPYILGYTEGETRRLILQDQIYRPITRQLFQGAGIGPGMSVLDLGSGAGDVSLLLAELVGPTGRVLGVDRNEAILRTARGRVDAVGWRNVAFVASQIETFDTDRRFDAMVGRWVLGYLPRPAETLAALLRFLVPGGIVAFGELELGIPPAAFPRMPPSARPLVPWLVPTQDTADPQSRPGARLFQIFIDAGLPQPQLRLDVPIGGGADWPGYEYLAETLRSMLPSLAADGFDARIIDIDTLADRLRSEVTSQNGTLRLAGIMGAWSRKP